MITLSLALKRKHTEPQWKFAMIRGSKDLGAQRTKLRRMEKSFKMPKLKNAQRSPETSSGAQEATLKTVMNRNANIEINVELNQPGRSAPVDQAAVIRCMKQKTIKQSSNWICEYGPQRR